MIRLKYLVGAGEVKVILCIFSPGQVETGFEIVPAHRRLGRLHRVALEPVALAQKLLFRSIVNGQSRNFIAELLNLLLGRYAVVELRGDDLQLLAQIVFALAVIHLLLNHLLNLVLIFEQTGLLEQEHAELFKALYRVELL